MWQSEDLRDLVRHLEWADAEIWRLVLMSPAEALDSKIELWLHHTHATQHAFVHLWRREPIELPEPSQFSRPADLARWGRQAHGGIHGFLDGVKESDLAEKLSIPWREELTARWGRPIHDVNLGESVMQVAMHSTHHRAQVASRLRELDVEPPTVDYIVWLWFGRPNPEWPDSL